MSEPIPTCIGRETIRRLARDGIVVFADGTVLVAASNLFQKDPYVEFDGLPWDHQPIAHEGDDAAL